MTNRLWNTAIERAGALAAPLAFDQLPDAELLKRFVAGREECAFAARSPPAWAAGVGRMPQSVAGRCRRRGCVPGHVPGPRSLRRQGPTAECAGGLAAYCCWSRVPEQLAGAGSAKTARACRGERRSSLPHGRGSVGPNAGGSARRDRPAAGIAAHRLRVMRDAGNSANRRGATTRLEVRHGFRPGVQGETGFDGGDNSPGSLRFGGPRGDDGRRVIAPISGDDEQGINRRQLEQRIKHDYSRTRPRGDGRTHEQDESADGCASRRNVDDRRRIARALHG